MSLTATFSADFQAFTKSIADAQVKLQVFDKAVKNSTRGLTRELENVSGQKLAVEAARMVEAVNRIGGVSKLTDTELRRLNSTLEEAAQKAQRMGETLPSSLQKVRDEIAKLPGPADDAGKRVSFLSDTFGTLTASFTAANLISRGVDSLIGFGKAALESAGAITDLANKTGLSTKTIQQMQAVAAQTGTSLDAFTSSAFKLGVAISDGSKTAIGAIKELGLAYEQLQSASPDEQFRLVVGALEQVESQTERNRLGVALFGRQFSEIAASIQEGYSQIAEGASISSDEQLRALDEAGNAWTRFVADTEKNVQRVLGSLVLLAQNRPTPKLEMSPERLREYVDQLKAAGKDASAWEEELRKVEAAQKDIFLSADTANKPQQDFVANLAKTTAEVAKLTAAERAQLDAVIKFGKGYEDAAKAVNLTEEAFELYKQQQQESLQAAKAAESATIAFGNSVEQNAQAARRATEELERFIDAQNRVLRDRGASTPNDFATSIRRQFGDLDKAILENAKKQAELQRTLTTETQQQTMTRVQFQIAQIERWAANETAALDRTGEAWRENAALIERIKDQRIETLIDDDVLAQLVLFANLTTEAEERVKALKREAGEKLANSLRDLSSAFADLAQATGQSDGLLGNIAELIGLMNLGSQAGQSFNEGLETLKEGGVANMIAGLQQMGASAIAAVGALEQATDVAGRANRAFRGAMVGAQIGQQIAGPIGAAVGAGVGAIVGAFRNPAFEDVMNRVGRDWGVDISEGLARSIADEAKRTFGNNRQAAEIFNLGAILEEAGGLNDANAGRFLERFRDVFVMLETGAFDAAQATAVLDENFAAFAEQFTREGGLVTGAFREIVTLARAAGLEVEALAEFTRGNLDASAEGFNSFFDAQKNASDKLSEHTGKLVKLQEQLGKAGADDRAKLEQEIAAITREMQTQQGVLDALMVTNEQQAAGLGGALAATFAGLMEGGASVTDALRQIAPSARYLGDELRDMGLSGGGAFDEIARLARLAEDEVAGPVLDAIDGLNQGLIGLNNTGLLNQDMFSGLASQVTQAFDSLVGQGKDGNDVLRLMQPTLQTLARLQNEFGFSVDDSTQAILDQANQMGLLEGQSDDTNTVLREGFDGVTEAIYLLTEAITGVPAEFDKAARASGTAANQMVDDARRVQGEVDAISFGHSPGGIKEIPIQLAKASASMESFRTDSLRDLDAVYGGLDALIFAIGDFNQALNLERQGAISPINEAAIEAIQEQIDALNAQQEQIEGSSPLKQMRRDLEDLNTAIDQASTKAQKAALEKQKDALVLAIQAEERRLEDIRDSLDAQIKDLEARIDTIKKEKNPFEGFAIPPDMLDTAQAIARVQEVFQQFAGIEADGGMLAKIAQAVNFNGVSIAKTTLDAFLKQFVDTNFEAMFNPAFFAQMLQDAQEAAESARTQGYASGTMGVHGRWFKNFGPESTVRTHGEEAIIKRGQERAFAEDVLGRGDGGRSSAVVAELRDLKTSIRSMLGNERYLRALAERDGALGAV